MHGSTRRASLGGDGGAANDKRATPRNTKALHKKKYTTKHRAPFALPPPGLVGYPIFKTNTKTQLK